MSGEFYEIGYGYAQMDAEFQDWLQKHNLSHIGWKQEVRLWHNWMEPHEYNYDFQEWYEKMFNWMGPELAAIFLEDKDCLYRNWLAMNARKRDNSLWRV